MSDPSDYPVLIRPLTAADGGGFVALVPDLPGCISDGKTPQEALANVQDAIVCWIEAAGEMGAGLSLTPLPKSLNCRKNTAEVVPGPDYGCNAQSRRGRHLTSTAPRACESAEFQIIELDFDCPQC
jgi:antitoxin HicB